MNNKEKHQKLSVFISLILRHKPEVIGLTLDSQGYLNVNELIEGINNSGRHIDNKVLDDIVNSDNKQRYSYNEDKSKIRANQGHSISVDLGLLECRPPTHLYHGTSKKYIDSIMNMGIQKQNRLHVHLSENIETALAVGGRRGKPVIITVNSGLMYKDGYKFFRSENNVWLTDKVNNEYLSINTKKE